MLPMPQRLAAQLERRRPERPVYAMAGPGSSLLDYAERVRFASEKLAIRDFVIVVERGDVAQSVCGSGNVHAACLDATTLSPRTERIVGDERWLTNLLRKSALAQYLFSQLRVNVQDLKARAKQLFERRKVPVIRSVVPGEEERRADAVIGTFFQRLEPYKDRNFTFVLGCDLNALTVDSKAAPDVARTRLIAAAHAWGARVVDTEPIFRTHVLRNGLALGVSPRDAHWNPLAIGLVAEAAVAAESPAGR